MGSRPVIGRAAELAAVDDALARARRCDGAVLAVVGPAGIGKTRLADAVAERAAGARALDEIDRPAEALPLLEQLTARLPPDDNFWELLAVVRQRTAMRR